MMARGGLKIDMRPMVRVPEPRKIARFAAEGVRRAARVSVFLGKAALGEGIAIARELKERREKRKNSAAVQEDAGMKEKLAGLNGRLEKLNSGHGGVIQDARGWYNRCGSVRYPVSRE